MPQKLLIPFSEAGRGSPGGFLTLIHASIPRGSVFTLAEHIRTVNGATGRVGVFVRLEQLDSSVTFVMMSSSVLRNGSRW